MSNLNNTIKLFTPEEFRKLHPTQITTMLENNTPFTVSNMVRLENHFTWCEATSSLFDENMEEVDLTRLEKRFLELLMKNRNEIVGYKAIKDYVWSGKDMSIYTMRNIVNKIRQKSFYEIIQNKSNLGYVSWQKS